MLIHTINPRSRPDQAFVILSRVQLFSVQIQFRGLLGRGRLAPCVTCFWKILSLPGARPRILLRGARGGPSGHAPRAPGSPRPPASFSGDVSRHRKPTCRHPGKLGGTCAASPTPKVSVCAHEEPFLGWLGIAPVPPLAKWIAHARVPFPTHLIIFILPMMRL